MRKIILASIFISTISFSFAQSAVTCLDLSANLSRGAESKNVLALQRFLVAKGLLKATPSGYFGSGTFAAVKAYQKSVGLAQVGNTGPATRASIKKDSCTNSATVQIPVTRIATSTPAPTAIVIPNSPVPAITHTRPSISSVTKGTLFAGGSTTWSVRIDGIFSTSSSTVFFTHRGSGRRYIVGNFPAASSTTITLPTSLTQNAYSCGTGCNEALPAGDYDVTVRNEGGESDPYFLSIKNFSVSSFSATLSAPVRQKATSTKLGTVSFAASVPFYISAMSSNFQTERIPRSGVSNIKFKDEVTGKTLSSFGTSVSLGENQSKIIGIYGDINSTSSGNISFSTVITIVDYVGKLPISFVSPPFLTSVSGF